MGTNVSVQDNVSITDIVNTNLTQISNDIDNGIVASATSNQTFNVTARGIRTKGDFNASQKTNMSMNAILNTNSKLSADLANQVTNQIEKKLKNDLEQVNKDLNIGQTNIAKTKNETVSKIKNNLSQIIKTGINNTVQSTTSGVQAFFVDLEFADIGGNVNLGQESQIATVAKSISETIAEAAVKNVTETVDKTALENTVKQKNAGVDIMAFASIFLVIVLVVGGGALYLMPNNPLTAMLSRGATTPPKKVGGGLEDIINTVGGTNNFIGIMVAIVVLILLLQYKIYVDYKKMMQNTIYAHIANQKKYKPPFTIFNYIL
jgi:hypothetical protein